MGQVTGIEWTNHTLNFWWGCFKVSDGCKNCYAETFSKRVGRNIWGPPQVTGRWHTKGPWTECLKWDKQAKAEGVRRNVFCQSMSDFFEDHPQVEPWRQEAIKILEGFEWLNVQLLTKRIENVLRMVPIHWLKSWPEHIWIGTSVEDQVQADQRIPELCEIPAKVRFLSCEPLLGPIDLSGRTVQGVWIDPEYARLDYGLGEIVENEGWSIHWVIVGGESGPQARPMHPDWARQIREQCQAAGVPFFFKQWGEFVPAEQFEGIPGNGEWGTIGLSGNYMQFTANHDQLIYRMGKHAAGRLLDGREWNEIPQREVAR